MMLEIFAYSKSDITGLYCSKTRALSQASGAAHEAKVVVSELQTRLMKEVEEREAEAAIYNARLYENEKRQGDWYVEKKLLEKRIREMDAEVTTTSSVLVILGMFEECQSPFGFQCC